MCRGKQEIAIGYADGPKCRQDCVPDIRPVSYVIQLKGMAWTLVVHAIHR